VDVGSLSTNVAIIDAEKRLLAKSYLPTAGRPLEAIKRGLAEVYEKVGDRVEVRGVGSTGSGRYLTGDFVGADVVRNEITSQATASALIDPEVDTIFEIGGQDSKYISLENGVVVDFEMNHACAAGTGSFLEEQAERLGINIVGEFGEAALRSKAPVRLGERCTVFMESDLVHYQQQGASVEALSAGLACSIVYNYLNRVVGHRRIGKRIFFQGGVAANRAVVAAFEKVMGKPVVVPLHHDVTGAIGVAILAMEHQRKRSPDAPTNFRGFDLSQRQGH
jgi:predicted CoA-substrate-specific enzyme activase